MAPRILDLDTRWRWVVSFTPRVCTCTYGNSYSGNIIIDSWFSKKTLEPYINMGQNCFLSLLFPVHHNHLIIRWHLIKAVESKCR